jgi:hypothetical protein
MSRPKRPAAAAKVAATVAAAASDSEDEEEQQTNLQQDEEDEVAPMDWFGGSDAASEDEDHDRGSMFGSSNTKGNAAQRRMLAVFEQDGVQKGVRSVFGSFGIFIPAGTENNRRLW